MSTAGFPNQLRQLPNQLSFRMLRKHLPLEMASFCHCFLISLHIFLRIPAPPSLLAQSAMAGVSESSDLLPPNSADAPYYNAVSQRHSVEAQTEAVSLLRAFLETNQLTLSAQHFTVLSQCLSRLLLSPRTETLLPVPALLTASTPVSYHVGTGRQLLNYVFDSILKRPTAVQQELLFVTCFWAKSTSLEYLARTLLELNRLHQRPRGDQTSKKLRIRICISSLSLSQKLFHTSLEEGYTYANTTRAYRRLGLPSPNELNNLDITIKSIFFRPISVLHGKFVIVDRKRLYLPSCNVSWEEWLEGMGVFEGAIVDSFLEYYQQIWGREILQNPTGAPDHGSTETLWIPKSLPPLSVKFHEDRHLPVIFLPQPHHATFPPLPFIPSFISKILACFHFKISPIGLAPPLTPQNVFASALVRHARRSIFIQTPNLTCPALLDLLYERLTVPGEPIHIELITCKNMMIFEQLITTGFGGPSIIGNENGKQRRWGATTEACVKELLRRLRAKINVRSTLSIYYYTPLPAITTNLGGDVESMSAAQEEMEMARQSHVKALIIDSEVTVVGSANGDRASSFTSGEVNVMVFGEEFAKGVKESLAAGVGNRRVKVETLVE